MLKIGHVITHPGRKPGDSSVTIPVPEELETVPGIPTNQREVDWYAREYPLEDMHLTERASYEWSNRIRDGHVEERGIRKEHDKRSEPLRTASRASGELEPTGKPAGEDVSQLIKKKAREGGFVEVGITAYDYRYTFQSKRDWVKFDHAICLASEREYGAVQIIPGAQAEELALSDYRQAAAGALELAAYIRSLGYRAQVHNPNEHIEAYIAMFVAAGLGQLGACGYLLGPHSGNRMRLIMITTDAKVTYDHPVDFGVHAFCQVCQVCVNRCPGRALMRDKIWWRGIEKNKVYYKRCRPVMARYSDCGICMKICPMQKYCMAAVMAHYVETGQVLGKGTHDLEDYTLPDKGYFGPGEMPVFEPGFFEMPHGGLDQWALETLKNKAQDSQNQITDEVLEEFRRDITRAFGGNVQSRLDE